MKKEKKNNFMLILGILLVVVIVTVGYAAIQSELNINGTANLGGAQWDIHFDNIDIPSTNTGVANVGPEITDDGLTVDYTVSLSTPGDVYEFDVDIVNAGTIDAVLSSHEMDEVNMTDVSYEVKVLDTSDGEYKAVDWNNFELAHNSSKTFHFRVEFLKDEALLATLENGATLDLGLTLDFVQK